VFSLLRSRGWSAGAIYGAFGRYYEDITGVAVPERAGIIEGARDGFLHLLSFGTLGTWTIALGAILFDYIDFSFPDPVAAAQYYSRTYQEAGNLACLLVAFPVYLGVTSFVLRDQARFPEKRDSSLRKWLTWLALLVAASVIIGDLITFVAYLLRGEITIRFALHVLVVFALAAGVFGYYKEQS